MKCFWCLMEASEGSLYCPRRDAHYSEDNNVWLDEKCTHMDCDYCFKRPKKHYKNCECLEHEKEVVR